MTTHYNIITTKCDNLFMNHIFLCDVLDFYLHNKFLIMAYDWFEYLNIYNYQMKSCIIGFRFLNGSILGF